MRKKLTFLRGLSLAGSLGLAFCSGGDMTTPDPTTTTSTTGPDYGFNHDDVLNNIGDIFSDGRQVSPALGETLHSCGEIRFDVLTTILQTRGINVTNNTMNSAGALLAKAQPVWGVANFPGRVPTAIRDTVSSLVSLHDVLIAAAEEWTTTTNTDGVFANMPMPPAACMGAQLFNNNACDPNGFACLMGAPPTAQQLATCTSMINDSTAGVTDPQIKRHLAIASMVGTVAMCD
jgi:hypothetical protein